MGVWKRMHVVYLFCGLLITLIRAEVFDLPTEKTRCLTKEFNQRHLKYGNLERRERSGSLSFSRDKPTDKVLPSEKCPFDILIGSTVSFALTLDYLTDEQRNNLDLNILLSTTDKDQQIVLTNWSLELFSNRTRTTRLYRCPPGNVESYVCMIRTLNQQAFFDQILTRNTIIYLLEDDYLHQASALSELLDIFASHDPCFAVPYDYADRYALSEFNDDDGRITLIAGKNRHWRTIVSTTCTLSGRLDTMLYFLALGQNAGLSMFPQPLDDYFASRRMADLGASIVSPLPGLAAHVESYNGYKRHYTSAATAADDDGSVGPDESSYVGLYYDWFKFGRDMVQYARDNIAATGMLCAAMSDIGDGVAK